MGPYMGAGAGQAIDVRPIHNSVAGLLFLKRRLGCIYPWPADCTSSYAALSRPRCPPHLRRDSVPDRSFCCQLFVVGWMDVHLHGTWLL
jgi:hypothetical protein